MKSGGLWYCPKCRVTVEAGQPCDCIVQYEPPQPPQDMVNKPPHYTRTTLETLDVIEDMVTGWDPKVAYLLGNVVKYVWRHADKSPVESLKKARFYLDRAIAHLEGK
jgi:hypothetical protein